MKDGEAYNAIVLDPDKCIKCGRCVTVCQEVQGIGEHPTWRDIRTGLKLDKHTNTKTGTNKHKQPTKRNESGSSDCPLHVLGMAW